MVQITDMAKEKIQEILDNNTGKYLRIFVQGMGWGGPKMGMALDEPEENEKPETINGVDVLIQEFARPFIDGKTIDYVSNFGGEGFVIEGNGGNC